MLIDHATMLDATPTEKRHGRAYRNELLAAGALYVVTLKISIATVDHAAGVLKAADALLPMIGVLALTAAIARYALRLDELQRRSFVVSLAIAAVVCAVVSMALGFLENAGLPRISLGYVWPMIMGVFGVSYPFVRRRYH